MAPRRVIADSDDEDGDDGPLSPLKGDTRVDPPEIEPLSPEHRPSSPGSLAVHDADVYDEQQGRTLPRSQLIEQIVLQSQKASRSSGEVSLPAKGKGKKVDASSATNVTSPAGLSKPRNRPSLFSDDASSITTPRKTAPGEWDVPSSAEDTPAFKIPKLSKGKNEKSYGKRRRSQSRLAGSPAVGDIFMGYDGVPGDTTQDRILHNEIPVESRGVEPSLQSPTKRRKVSLYDSVLQDTAPTTNFYVAQSSLTTMQKLEYQKVNVSQNSYLGLPGPLNNLKSSGVTTVAYPTPSRYASSSGPPLPWERDSADAQLDESTAFIDVNSSPDIIIAGHDLAENAAVGTSQAVRQAGRSSAEILTGDAKSTSNKKRRKRPRSIEDEDELVQDEPWSPEVIDRRRDNQNRRCNESGSNSTNLQEDNENIELVRNPREMSREIGHAELPREEIPEANEVPPDMPATAPPIPLDVPEDNPPEQQPEAQLPQKPKRRGRKKKQPAGDQTAQNEPPTEDQASAREQIPVAEDPEVHIEPEKPKKKRGRPRKSDLTKSETAATPGHEPLAATGSHGDDTQPIELTSENEEVIEKPRAKKKQQARSREEGTGEINDTSSKGGGVGDALKEISSNSKLPSQGSTSNESGSAESITKPSADQNLSRKSRDKDSSTAKATPTPTPTPASSSSQPKVPYRVGLSKRTRITSLLKSIKR